MLTVVFFGLVSQSLFENGILCFRVSADVGTNARVFAWVWAAGWWCNFTALAMGCRLALGTLGLGIRLQVGSALLAPLAGNYHPAHEITFVGFRYRDFKITLFILILSLCCD